MKRKRKSAKQRKRFDYEIIGTIPKNTSYQWIAESICGDTETADNAYGYMIANGGWKPVPSRRHPKMPKKSGHIVFEGQVLMERPLELTQAAQAQERKIARELFAAHPASPDYDGKKLFVTNLDELGSANEYSERLAQNKAEAEVVRFSFPHIINIFASSKDIDAAAVCGLSVAEYMRRKVLIRLQCPTIVTMRSVADGTFEFVNLLVSEKKENHE